MAPKSNFCIHSLLGKQKHTRSMTLTKVQVDSDSNSKQGLLQTQPDLYKYKFPHNCTAFPCLKRRPAERSQSLETRPGNQAAGEDAVR